MFSKIFILLLAINPSLSIQNLVSNCSQLTISQNNQYLGYYPNLLSSNNISPIFSQKKTENSIFFISQISLQNNQFEMMNLEPRTFTLKNKNGFYLKVDPNDLSRKIILGEVLDENYLWNFTEFNGKFMLKSSKFNLFAEFSPSRFRLHSKKQDLNNFMFFEVRCLTEKCQKKPKKNLIFAVSKKNTKSPNRTSRSRRSPPQRRRIRKPLNLRQKAAFPITLQKSNFSKLKNKKQLLNLQRNKQFRIFVLHTNNNEKFYFHS